MLKIFLFIFLILSLFSCKYPDIDTVPNFDSLNITMEESLDKCKIKRHGINNEELCINEEIISIISRL
tara:strand:+ start:242 stop:445 length:204 start_codon:yes stop_codon:yes gene_type:complete